MNQNTEKHYLKKIMEMYSSHTLIGTVQYLQNMSCYTIFNTVRNNMACAQQSEKAEQVGLATRP